MLFLTVGKDDFAVNAMTCLVRGYFHTRHVADCFTVKQFYMCVSLYVCGTAE